MRRWMRAAAAALFAAVGYDEALLLVSLTFITAALWPHLGVSALGAPGIVLLWIALPPRGPFLPSPPTKKERG